MNPQELRDYAKMILKNTVPLIQAIADGKPVYARYELVDRMSDVLFHTDQYGLLGSSEVYMKWKPGPEKVKEATEELKRYKESVPPLSSIIEHPCGQCDFKGNCCYLFGEHGETCLAIRQGHIYLITKIVPWENVEDMGAAVNDWFMCKKSIDDATRIKSYYVHGVSFTGSDLCPFGYLLDKMEHSATPWLKDSWKPCGKESK